MHFFHKTH